MRHNRTWTRFGMLAALAAMLGVPAAAQAEERADELLESLAAHYATIEDLSYDIQMYSMQEAAGQRDENDLRIAVKLKRPNKVAVDLRDAAGDESPDVQIRSNGEVLNAYQAEANRYSTQAAPDDIAGITRIQGLVQATGGMIDLALAPMTDNPVGEMVTQAPRKEYVGERELDGGMYDVIRFDTGQQVALDVYLTTGDEPRMHRVQIDFSAALEQARQFGQEIEAEAYIQFDNWEAGAGIEDATFDFDPPADAEEVASLVERPEHPMTNAPAAEFNLERLGGGERGIAEHQGRDVVILDFWATWCGPCVRAMPMLIDVAEHFEDRNVVFYAVNLRESEDEIEAFLQEHGMEIDHVLLDRRGDVAQAYGVEGIPQTVIVDRQGVIRSVHVGFAPDLDDALIAEVEAILAENE